MPNKTSTKDITWSPLFGPSYTPLEAIEMGIFEGKYMNSVKGVPDSWKASKKVLGLKDKPDETLNHFGVKSRQPLSVWKENGWVTKDSPYGWWQWYCLYFVGRRLGEEDTWQINRWRSFVARHQGQVSAKCKLNDNSCNTRQRQGLLQWGWDSSIKYSPEQIEKNAKLISRRAGVPLLKEQKKESMENYSGIFDW